VDYFLMLDLVQGLADGILFGTTYALIGIGFTLIFGVMHKLNLAYGAASIGGAYVGMAAFLGLSAPPILVFLISALGAAALGFLVYVCCFRYTPLRHPLAALMASVGMLLFIDEMVVHLSAGMPYPFPSVMEQSEITLGDIWIRGDLIFVFAMSVVSMIVLLWLLYRTRLGIATRAVSQQATAARLCGINPDHINASTFVITGALGGIAGAMTGAAVGVLSPLLAVPLTVKGLIVAVIGGLGSIPGAIIAGLMVGAAENIFLVLRGITERDIYVMLLLFIFLVLRPGGIFRSTSTSH
jgi:branched-chain amino acid transport system permease protein